ncbi:MAG: hypothetical protein N3C12_10075 [Candidatus Binatia bacterium]|nr:hypothetical protein [Candidatus Binatia bacterium]
MSQGEQAPVDLTALLVEWREQLQAARVAVERACGTVERLQQTTLYGFENKLETLREDLGQLRQVVQSLHNRGGTLPAELESIEEAARAAHAALERLSVLDATQAASLQAVGEELRNLRADVERLLERLGSLPDEPAAGAEHSAAAAGGVRGFRSSGEPMLEIVRMHVELLRTLLERGAPPPRAPVPVANSEGEHVATLGVQATGATSGTAQEEPSQGALGRLCAELRGIAASLEHQLSELREEEQRRVHSWERRLEEMQHTVDHLASLDHGRRLFFAVGLGLVFVLAVVAAGLGWYRAQSVSAPTPMKETERSVARGTEEKEFEYQRLLGEAEVALAQEEWDKAERILAQASRLRPESRGALIALSAVRARKSLAAVEPPEGGGSGRSPAALNCAVRDGRLCCWVGPNTEQCVAWPVGTGGQAFPTSPPTPTPRARQRAARTTAVEPPPVDDEF